MQDVINNKGSKIRLNILQKADELIFEKGYHQMSFGDIAKAMNMAKGNFYYYFKSKEAILDGVVSMRVSYIQDMLFQWEKEFTSPKDRLKRFVDILDNERSNVMNYGCPIGSLFVELGKGEKSLQKNIKPLFQVFIDWLAVQFALINVKSPDNVAKTLVAKTQGVALMTNVLAEEEFIDQSIVEIKQWIDAY